MAQAKKHRSKRGWLNEHFSDPYVQRAQQEGYRSRAAYKLLEIQQRDRLIRPGMTVVDLGAAPGGWSQVAARLTGRKGRVIASDILEMDPLPGVEFLQGDFREEPVFEQLLARLDGQPVDLVISDMAPNISGMDAVDQPRAMYLAELVLDMARKVLVEGRGAMLVKVFQGSGFEAYLREVRQGFARVVTRKPDASRSRSREVYIVGKNILRCR